MLNVIVWVVIVNDWAQQLVGILSIKQNLIFREKFEIVVFVGYVGYLGHNY